MCLTNEFKLFQAPARRGAVLPSRCQCLSDESPGPGNGPGSADQEPSGAASSASDHIPTLSLYSRTSCICYRPRGSALLS